MFTQDFVQKLLSDSELRHEACSNSFEMFINIYMSSHLGYPMAPFQKEIISALQNDLDQTVVLTGFRGCGKSTIATTMFPIWAMSFREKKLIIILSKTQAQAEQHLRNLKNELEANDVLKKDLGPFFEFSDEWHRQGIHIQKYDCKIMAASIEQSIRGIKHRSHRPDLIIADDIEDSDSVNTLESRNKIDKYLREEILFAGDKETRFIMVGNKLHQDAVIMRIKDGIENGTMEGRYMEFPILDANGNPQWVGKFATKEDVEKERKRIGDEVAWEREALLNPIDPKKQIIKKSDIHYWDQLPEDIGIEGAVGVDLASELHSKADFTAMIGALFKGHGDALKIFIKTPLVRARLEFDEQIKVAKEMANEFKTNFQPTFYVEKVAYQTVFIQKLRSVGIYPKPVVPLKDKATRLHLVAPYIRNGTVLFPKKGAEELINELVNFGSTKHDDLVDALVLLIHELKEKNGMGVATVDTLPTEPPFWNPWSTDYNGLPVEPTREMKLAHYARAQQYIDDGWAGLL